MKILQIFNKYLFEGGEEKSVGRIFSHLGKVHEVRQISFESKSWAEEKGGITKFKQALLMVYNPGSLKKVKNVMKEFQPEIILIHNLFPVGSAALLDFLTRQKLPVVYYVHNFRPYSVNGYLWANGKIRPSGLKKNFLPEIIHGSWQDSRVKTLWYALIIMGLHLLGSWRRISQWIAISDFMKETFVTAGVPENRISVVRHSWKIRQSRLEREQFNDSMPFVYLGRLSEQKGIRVLLKAWEMVIVEHPAARLVICGEGPLEKEVRETSKRLSSIEFHGFVSGEEKRKLLLSCRCLLAPSIWFEPLGLVVFDGYEYSLPVIASAAGGLREIVQCGQTGLLVERGKIEDLAEGICRMINLPDGGVEMGRNGRIWLERHTTEVIWNELVSNVFVRLEQSAE